MNELRRAAYLEAMGLDAYVSRRQLPGAAVTRRLAIVSRPPGASPAAGASLAELQGRLDTSQRGGPAARDTGETGSARASRGAAPEAPSADANLPRFSLSAIVAGNWLWLEELGSMPLAVEQVRLVEAMALALSAASGDQGVTAQAKPEVAQFDWPIHTNRQLELGEDAARAALTGYVGRRLEEFRCAGLVLLGQQATARVPVRELGIQVACTRSSLDILANPELKQQVWRDLLPLVTTS